MKLNRRGLLGLMAGIVGSGFFARPARASGPADEKKRGSQLAALMDLSLCTGCRVCEKACAKANRMPDPERPYEDMSVLNVKRRPSATALTVVNRYRPPESATPVYRKIQCNHCQDPACASACFVKAMVKTPEGPVVYNPDLCVGCRYCMAACPFYVPAYEYEEPWAPRVMKCSMCYERTVEKKGVPACVESCPLEAILFGKRDELIETARARIERHPGKYQKAVYGEHEAGGTNWMYLSSVPFDRVGLPDWVGNDPYPDLTKGAMGAVPAIALVWPLLLAGVYGLNGRKNKKQSGAEPREANDQSSGNFLAESKEPVAPAGSRRHL